MSINKPTYLPPIIKGDADYRTYRPILLDNGITILLAHDPQSKHFAASVSVHAGASSDPRALPGLAHFCEHMCFLGSKAYPEENEYKQYLAQHGGKSNASTSMSHTTYQFDVLADHGEKVLDIFTNFFISPLFSKSGSQREVNAVDSENSKNLVSDGRRRLQVLKSLADEEHHYSKFSTGNKITLPACGPEDETKDGKSNDTDKNIDAEKHPLEETIKQITGGKYDEADMAEFVRAALLAFHERHYRPKNMTAVMIGPQSLDELEAWVVPRFGQIPDRWLDKENGQVKDDEEGDDSSTDKEKWEAMQRAAAKLVGGSASDAPPIALEAAETVQHRSAFRPELQGGTWPVVVTTKPLQSVRKLVLHFPLPPTWHIPDRSPTSLLSHLFGHEGKGSPFAVLQDKQWISALSSGSRVSAPDQNLFQIGINLTEEGEKHWKDVAQVIFDYGKMVCSIAEESLASEGKGADACKNDKLRQIWDEVVALDRMRFHQTSPGAVYSFAPSVAQSISKHGTEKCLSTGSLLEENAPLEEMLEFCKLIMPENCFIERCSGGAWEEMEGTYGEEQSKENKVFGRKVEQWYGVDYFISPVDKEDISLWETGTNDALHLPEPNRYIPRSLDLCPDLPEEAKVQRIEKPIDPPQLIINQPETGRLWWRLDDRYALPKASITLLIRTATAENKLQPTGAIESQWDFDADTSLRSNYLTSMFSDAMAQNTYDAYLSGLYWSLSKSSSGFTLSCSGYSDRLSDFALHLLTDFCNVGASGDDTSFLKESHFLTTKDKLVRGLKSFHESRRADSLALYYSNLLLSSKGMGVENNLQIASAMTFDDVVKKHKEIWTDDNMLIEAFYTGNVSQNDAKDFYEKASNIIKSTQSKVQERAAKPIKSSSWVPGPFERRLPPGEDLELHFSSKNPKEENGAVIVTFQSQMEGFRGESLSSEESLEQSAAIRLLCKMIKEPCFNELRTKQQLGYIVSSYYDINHSTRQSDFFEPSSSMSNAPAALQLPLTTSIDSLVVYVLSRKEKPTEVASRIDDFLLNFKSRLEDMTDSEINDYADSLAKALTKPIRKLGDEASNHMAKIRKYAPETLAEGSGHSGDDLPWNNPQVLASAIRSLDREKILKAYDSLVLSPSRSRIVSFVYGKTFPLEPNWSGGKSTASSMQELLARRNTMITFDPSTNYTNSGNGFWKLLGTHKTTLRYAAAAAAVGVGVWGVMSMKGKGDGKKAQVK